VTEVTRGESGTKPESCFGSPSVSESPEDGGVQDADLPILQPDGTALGELAERAQWRFARGAAQRSLPR